MSERRPPTLRERTLPPHQAHELARATERRDSQLALAEAAEANLRALLRALGFDPDRVAGFDHERGTIKVVVMDTEEAGVEG